MGTYKACLTPLLLFKKAQVVSTAWDGGSAMNSLIRARRAKSGRRVVRKRAKMETISARWGMSDNRVYHIFMLVSIDLFRRGEYSECLCLRGVSWKTYSQLFPRGRTGNIHDSREEHHAADDVEVSSRSGIGVGRCLAFAMAPDHFHGDVGAHGMAHDNDAGPPNGTR